MNLLVDTCTWLKIDKLQSRNKYDHRDFYSLATLHVTHDVVDELIHYGCNSWKREKTRAIPIGNEAIFREALDLNFDTADASILSNGTKDDNLVIVSEDRALLKFAEMYKFSAVQLIDLFRLFTPEHFSKRDLYNLTKALRELRNITKKKEKEMKTWLARYRASTRP
ncbi:MAG: hypothetical protein ACTSU5_12085 [Promethearchaeota archaeon]